MKLTKHPRHYTHFYLFELDNHDQLGFVAHGSTVDNIETMQALWHSQHPTVSSIHTVVKYNLITFEEYTNMTKPVEVEPVQEPKAVKKTLKVEANYTPLDNKLYYFKFTDVRTQYVLGYHKMNKPMNTSHSSTKIKMDAFLNDSLTRDDALSSYVAVVKITSKTYEQGLQSLSMSSESPWDVNKVKEQQEFKEKLSNGGIKLGYYFSEHESPV